MHSLIDDYLLLVIIIIREFFIQMAYITQSCFQEGTVRK